MMIWFFFRSLLGISFFFSIQFFSCLRFFPHISLTHSVSWYFAICKNTRANALAVRCICFLIVFLFFALCVRAIAAVILICRNPCLLWPFLYKLWPMHRTNAPQRILLINTNAKETKYRTYWMEGICFDLLKSHNIGMAMRKCCHMRPLEYVK